MAGVTNIAEAPWPVGTSWPQTLGGHCANNAAVTTLYSWLVPWDCFIIGVNRTLAVSEQAAFPDNLTLATVDDSKTIVATLANPSAAIAGVAQTLHSDIVGYQIQKGDVITATYDTASGEDCHWYDTLLLKPVYS